MAPLSAEDLILARELGERQAPVQRAVTMLALALPGRAAGELRRLSLGRRNAHLLRLRERLFGPELFAFAECQHCGEALELKLNANELRGEDAAETPDSEFELEYEGFALRFRLLDGCDLEAAAASAGVAAARKLLVERCLLEARHEDRLVAAEELPPAVIERLAEGLAQCDPQAETLIDLVCPACERGWQIAFDIASFLYTEISAQARRLLREVHALARAYAWREADILAMSARRRRDYLELLVQ